MLLALRQNCERGEGFSRKHLEEELVQEVAPRGFNFPFLQTNTAKQSEQLLPIRVWLRPLRTTLFLYHMEVAMTFLELITDKDVKLKVKPPL